MRVFHGLNFSPMSLSNEKILTTKYVTLSRTLLIHVLFFVYIIEAAGQQEMKYDRVLATIWWCLIQGCTPDSMKPSNQ